MKNIFVTTALAVAALGFTACNNDDDNATPNPMVGEWRAETVSYVRPDTGETMTHDFSLITNGCDVDELELREDYTADLETESKVNDLCVEAHTMSAWNDTSVIIPGEALPRELVAVTASELTLKYTMTYQFGTTEVTVKYSKS